MIKKAEILDLENKLYQAIKNNNTEVLEELLHDDLLFIIPSGETITKQMDLKTYLEGDLKITELTPNVEQLNIIDDLAIITLQLELKGSYKNNPFEGKFRYIRFWKSFTSGIKVVGGSGRNI